MNIENSVGPRANSMPNSHLERKLTFFPLTNIVIANMIGAGIFTTSGLLMQDLRNPGMMLLLWLAGGLIALCGAFFHSLSQIHSRFHVPVKAILLQGIISSCMVLSGSFDQILSYLGFSLGIFPILAVFGVFKLRRQKRSVLKIPGYPITTLVYLGTGTAILTLAFLERPVESGVALATVFSGIPVYYFFKREKDI